MWSLKEEYKATYPNMEGLPQQDIVAIMALTGGWITEGYETGNFWTAKFEYRAE